MRVRRSQRHIVVWGTAAALALSACGGDDPPERAGTVEESSNADSSSESSAEPVEGETSSTAEVELDSVGRVLTEEEAEAALPAVSSLPTGWSVDDSDDGAADDADDLPDDDEIEPAECKAVMEDMEDAWDEDPVGEADRDYMAGMLGPFMHVEINSFEEEVPEETFGEVLTALETCKEFTSTEDGVATTFTVSPLSFPNYGEESAAVRLSAESEGIAIALDLVMVRAGHNALNFIHMSLGGAADSAEALEQLAAETIAALEEG